jgi:hypothetical protein
MREERFDVNDYLVTRNLSPALKLARSPELRIIHPGLVD